MDFFEIPGHRGSLRSAGVDKSIAGNPADGAIIDDPFGKREDAESPTMRQRVWDWYANDLYTRLSADAWIVLTHTRWHRDDLAGRCCGRWPTARRTDGTSFVAGGRRGGPCRRLKPVPPWRAAWPEFKSARRPEDHSQQDARAYAALYQQNPTDAFMAEWPRSCSATRSRCRRRSGPRSST